MFRTLTVLKWRLYNAWNDLIYLKKSNYYFLYKLAVEKKEIFKLKQVSFS